MFPLINTPTRNTNHSATLVDNISSSYALGISHNSEILVSDITDRLPISTIREENLVIREDVPMTSHKKVRKKSKKNMKMFCDKLAMESWHSVYNAVDADTAYNNFIQIIGNLFVKCCPIIIMKSKRKNVDKPWNNFAKQNPPR